MVGIQDIDIFIERFSSGRISSAEFANEFRPVLQSALKSNEPFFKEFALAVTRRFRTTSMA